MASLFTSLTSLLAQSLLTGLEYLDIVSICIKIMRIPREKYYTPYT